MSDVRFMATRSLAGRRVLVVEDEPLLALNYGEIIAGAGAKVVGPATTLEEALELAEADRISVALLDIRIDYQEIWPVARVLAGRGVPFVFCTGHFDRLTISREWADRPILSKPVGALQIIKALKEAAADPAPG